VSRYVCGACGVDTDDGSNHEQHCPGSPDGRIEALENEVSSLERRVEMLESDVAALKAVAMNLVKG
jgi:uncharacterized protein YceH (UPF0502 family)